MLRFEPLDGPFGVRAVGAKLDRLNALELEAVLHAWQQHPLVLFEDQTLSEAALVTFSQHFGELERFDRDDMYRPPHPEVLYVSNLLTQEGVRLGNLGGAELNWHTDQSYKTRPATGAVFHAILMPEDESAGRTDWCSTEQAYAALSSDRQTLLEGLTSVSRYNGYLRENLDAAAREALAARYPPVEHPLVLKQPQSGRACLYLDISTAYAIHGIDPEAGARLLAELAAHMTDAAFVYRHRWHAGEVMLWDNARLCHRRDALPPATPRIARRTSIFMDPARFAVPAP